jgi:alpha-beta hydrolase superfamily lysophospholipase
MVHAQAHRAGVQGFHSRAAHIPVHALWVRAQRHGRRLYLCGHSLGGAVAALATLHLLHHLNCPPFDHGACMPPPPTFLSTCIG